MVALGTGVPMADAMEVRPTAAGNTTEEASTMEVHTMEDTAGIEGKPYSKSSHAIPSFATSRKSLTLTCQQHS